MSDLEDLEEFNQATEDPVSSDENQPVPEITNTEAGAETTQHSVGDSQMWSIFHGRNYIPSEGATEHLPPGQYTIDFSTTRGMYFSRVDINLDELFVLPDSATETVLDQIEEFWSKEQHFRRFGFLWKRGIMLWGPPGSGKTSALQLLSAQVVERGGLAVYIDNPSIGAAGLTSLRQIEPTRPLVVMLEDIDAMFARHGEPEILALLDGELQIDNVVFVATTNYPEKLDKRLKNRPSRFDYVKKIGMPSSDARALYLKKKNPRLAENKIELQRWVNQTQGFSIAHLKELIVSVEVFQVDFEEAVMRLRAMIDTNISSDHNEGSMFGFVQCGEPETGS